MNIQDFSDVVVAVVAVIIPFVFTFLAKYFTKNKKALDLLEALEPVAKSAVVAVAKLQDDGIIKKTKAVEKVMDALYSLGFDDADREVVEDAVEHAYADMKDQLDHVYQDNHQNTASEDDSKHDSKKEVNNGSKDTSKSTTGTPLGKTIDKDGNVIL